MAQKVELDKNIRSEVDSIAKLLASDTLFDYKSQLIQELNTIFLEKVFKDSVAYLFDFETINTQISEDRKLNILTGFYTEEPGVPKYYLFYQYWGNKYMYGSIFHSVGVDFDDPDLVDLREGEWFGAMYYQIKDFRYSKDIQLYLLFGLSLHKGAEYRKIVEPVYFENGQIQFGYPIFKLSNSKKLHERYIIQYSWDSSPRLRFDKEMNLIIFDHMMPAPSMYEKGLMTMVPDGTYEGFELKKNIWHHIPVLPIEKLEEPPNINRKRNKTRDILGRENK